MTWRWNSASCRPALYGLIETVTGDSPESAGKVMRAHVRYGLEDMLKAVEYHTKAGDWLVRSRSRF